ncbi:MAG TPA: pepsin-like aspartyl protease, partial [Flavobacterium sp.]|nr:pepsin-like aspartyl protease [Flavobacterium sp.]
MKVQYWVLVYVFLHVFAVFTCAHWASFPMKRNVATLNAEQGLTWHPSMKIWVKPMMGCSALDFTVTMHIGDQGPFNLIVDSGSTILTVASHDCSTCNVYPTYNPYNSTTATLATNRALQITYGDGSLLYSKQWRDFVSMEGIASSRVSIVFASIYQVSTNLFATQGCHFEPITSYNQGVLGLGFHSLLQDQTESWWAKVVTQHGIP